MTAVKLIQTQQAYTYHIAICEDDDLIRESIRHICSETLEEKQIDYEIKLYPNTEQLENYLENKGQVFDLLILDIEMGEGRTGLEYALELRKKHDRTSIIFVTGHDEYLKDGYEVQPIQYLLKPLDPECLKKALLTDWKVNQSPKTAVLCKGRRNIRIPLDQFVYAESDGNHGVRIVFANEEISFPAGLSELKGMLPENQFARCHNSYLVNLKHVREVTRQNIHLDNGTTLPVSRKYYESCLQEFVSYINM